VKKKLVYIIHDLQLGGAEVALVSGIPQLAQKYNLSIIILGTIDPKMIVNLSVYEKDTLRTFNYPIYLYPIFLPIIIYRILKFSPDIMICSLWRASLLGTIIKKINKNIKFFSFNHSTRFPHFFSKFFTLCAARNADVILTDGDATTAFVKSQLSLNTPIRAVSFLTHPTPLKITSLRLEKDKVVKFMFLGRINKVKNLPMVIEVIRFLKSNSIHAQLDIYGRNDGNSDEAMAVIKEGRLESVIHFKGEISSDKRIELFGNYNFYIQLSSFEGMAMSVAEAMQNGLVCVVSPVGEIIHYAKDMDSAIFIDIFKPNWKTDLQKVMDVISKPALHSEISQKCHRNFLKKVVYSDSLIHALEQ
jgi:glycosyltransferase involved in cell wall biosynthesis